jgi:hypothetical protein
MTQLVTAVTAVTAFPALASCARHVRARMSPIRGFASQPSQVSLTAPKRQRATVSLRNGPRAQAISSKDRNIDRTAQR